jgi:hypothetical protein
VKHFRGHVFSDCPVTHPAGHKRAHPFEMQLIQRAEFRGVALCASTSGRSSAF